MIVVLDTSVWISALEFGAISVEATGEVIGVCRDRNDNAILETALKAHADYLVAGDKDLLSLGTFGKTMIISPAAYLEFQ